MPNNVGSYSCETLAPVLKDVLLDSVQREGQVQAKYGRNAEYKCVLFRNER